MVRWASALLAFPCLAAIAGAFDVSLQWDVPDDAQDITQASASVHINSTAPPGTEWTGIGWDHGSLSLQKLANDELAIIMQVRAAANTTVRAGRVTEYATAHYIRAQDGMYLQSRGDAGASDYSLKVIAHYNMVANNTIYQGLWSDGHVWTYMGSLVLQHPKTGSIKEEVSKALEEAARIDAPQTANNTAEGDGSKDPLAATRAPERLATCDINRDATGRISPVCRFLKQLPMVASFPRPYSALRRTSGGSPKFERAGLFKDLSLKSRLATVYDITAARCISHNRLPTDMASCQRDPNNPEFLISIDGASLAPASNEREEIVPGSPAEDPELLKERNQIHHEASKLPEVDVL
ncbi:hypothetical protein H4R19_002347 [Coemansia spiralis]|nr:hypothetical protein H4R19_002347 [Coemansia spiralis]